MGSVAVHFTLGYEGWANAKKKKKSRLVNRNVMRWFCQKEKSNRMEVGGEGRHYFSNHVVQYYREDTFTCTYVQKLYSIEILRG